MTATEKTEFKQIVQTAIAAASAALGKAPNPHKQQDTSGVRGLSVAIIRSMYGNLFTYADLTWEVYRISRKKTSRAYTANERWRDSPKLDEALTLFKKGWA